MIYLTIDEVEELHRRLLARTGGLDGVRDRGALDSAVSQPRMAFGGQDLYPTTIDKAAALGYSLIANHAFIDGNKRVGHAAMEVFLVLNNHEILASTDEQEAVVLRVAAGEMSREEFADWLRNHTFVGLRTDRPV